MESSRTKIYVGLWFAAFVVYTLAAAEPLPEETVLNNIWLKSLGSSYAESVPEEASLLPVDFGDYFGYVTPNGQFSVLSTRKNLLSQAKERWAEYEAVPSVINVKDERAQMLFSIEKPGGYPLFLDNHIYIVSPEQISVTEINSEGKRLWTREFSSPLTCVDSGGGLFLAGSLDGTFELLDSTGNSVFSFEPGGSRIGMAAGCALSRDGKRIAVVAGVDEQRFLLLEKYGQSYRVVYHEFLGAGFRRPVMVTFIDKDRRAAFECRGSLGVYDIESRESCRLALSGELAAVDEQGQDGLFFAVTTDFDDKKNLYMIKYPGFITMRAGYETEDVFLGRDEARLYVGGGSTLAAFEVDKR